MRNLKLGIVFAARVLLVAPAFDALAQTEARYAELPNFHLVNSQLYRGAQPRAGGLQTLKNIGLKPAKRGDSIKPGVERSVTPGSSKDKAKSPRSGRQLFS